MSESSDRLKILKIKLNINMKGHQTMVYAPYMTVPGETGSEIYFIPTVPLTRSTVSEAIESINKKKPTTDDIAKTFFSKVDTLNVINKMIEIADQRGSPVFPIQFTKVKDLLGGSITRTSTGKFIFKKEGGQPMRLVPVSKSLEQKDNKTVNKMNVNFVRAKNYKYESRIVVSNVSLDNMPYPGNAVVFEFKNSVNPLTMDQAIEKGVLIKNIKFLMNLLFNPNQTFYYKGQEKFDYSIYSYAVEKSARNDQRVWDLSPDGNVVAITVRLRLKPLVRELEKGTVQKKQSLQGCKFIRADIIRQLHEMNNWAVPDDLDSQGLVDDPEANNADQSTQFKRSDRPFIRPMPQGTSLPVNPTLVAQPLQRSIKQGGKTTRKRHRKPKILSRRHR